MYPNSQLCMIHFFSYSFFSSLQVLSIFRLATKFVKPTIVNFADRYGIPRPDLYYCMDKLTPVIFQRTGDTSSRVREIAKQQILDMAQWPQVIHSILLLVLLLLISY